MRYPLGKRLPFDELQHQGWYTAAVFEPVNRADVRGVERGQHARLAIEASEPFAIVAEHRREHLDRNVASQLGVVSAKDVAHPAGAEPRVDAIYAYVASSQVAANSRAGHTRFR